MTGLIPNLYISHVAKTLFYDVWSEKTQISLFASEVSIFEIKNDYLTE